MERRYAENVLQFGEIIMKQIISEKTKRALVKLDPDPIKIDGVTHIKVYAEPKPHFEAEVIIMDISADKLVHALKTGKYCSVLWQNKAYIGVIKSLWTTARLDLLEATIVGYL